MDLNLEIAVPSLLSKFLEGKGLMDAYLENVIHYNLLLVWKITHAKEEKITYVIEPGNLALSKSFVWVLTEQGDVFWRMMNDEYISFLEKQESEIQSMPEGIMAFPLFKN